MHHDPVALDPQFKLDGRGSFRPFRGERLGFSDLALVPQQDDAPMALHPADRFSMNACASTIRESG